VLCGWVPDGGGLTGKLIDAENDACLVSTERTFGELSITPNKPLWLQQAEEANAHMDDTDSDNYSYEDDAEDAHARVLEIEMPAQKERHFDVEWHGLLSRLGGEFGGAGGIDETALRGEFEAMDSDGNGSLDVTELAIVFQNLGINVKPYKIANLLSLADEDGNGTIEWPEFAKIVKLGMRWKGILNDLGTNLGKKRGPVVEYTLKKEFEKIDVDGNGSLDAEELGRLFRNLHVTVEEDLPERLLALGDKNGNGTIEWDEFRKMFHVINTVARLTKPRKNAKNFVSGERIAKGKVETKRGSCIEWQTIIQEVGQKIKRDNVKVDDKSLRKQFDRMDTSGDGALDTKELMAVFTDMGITLDEPKVKSLVMAADDDGNNMIEWHEFKRMFDVSIQWHEFIMKLGKSMQSVGPLTDNILRRQFVTIDKDNSGSLDIGELRLVFKNLNIDIDERTLNKLLLLADGDGSNAIEWPEFKRMFQVVNAVAKNNQKGNGDDLWSPRSSPHGGGYSSPRGGYSSPRGGYSSPRSPRTGGSPRRGRGSTSSS